VYCLPGPDLVDERYYPDMPGLREGADAPGGGDPVAGVGERMTDNAACCENLIWLEHWEGMGDYTCKYGWMTSDEKCMGNFEGKCPDRSHEKLGSLK
jgi:hypothetical protein